MNTQCPFCHSSKFSDSYLPGTFFNGKNFRYLKCSDCELIYLDPFPSVADYEVMYPPAYQAGANLTIIDDNTKLPGLRFPYSKHYELLSAFAPGKQIADYGCGNGNFVVNANKKGFLCDGVEYNPKHLEVLRSNIPASHFFQIDEFLRDDTKKYDAIRLSNVLEHLEHPGTILDKLSAKLKPSGILLVEGPLETNFSPAFLVRKLYFRLLKNKKAHHPPTHIFFANAKNQREFFRKHGLQQVFFEVKDCEWPFPENLSEAKGMGGLFKFLVARFSKAVCAIGNKWGNTFIYVGRRS